MKTITTLLKLLAEWRLKREIKKNLPTIALAASCGFKIQPESTHRRIVLSNGNITLALE